MLFGTEEQRNYLTILFGAAQGRELSLRDLNSLTSSEEAEKKFRESINKLMDRCIGESRIIAAD